MDKGLWLSKNTKSEGGWRFIIMDVVKQEIVKQEIKKWEKAFEKKMTKAERIIFGWGLVYGFKRAIKELKTQKDGDL